MDDIRRGRNPFPCRYEREDPAISQLTVQLKSNFGARWRRVHFLFLFFFSFFVSMKNVVMMLFQSSLQMFDWNKQQQTSNSSLIVQLRTTLDSIRFQPIPQLLHKLWIVDYEEEEEEEEEVVMFQSSLQFSLQK